MKYKRFSRLIIGCIIIVVVGSGVLITSCISRTLKEPEHSQSSSNSTPAAPSNGVSGGVPAGVPGGTPGGVPGGYPGSLSGTNKIRATTAELKQKLGKWLADNPDRHGMMRREDILPRENFRATAIRFPQSDAIKWSNNDSQWSQIRIDLDRDGRDDEKWLLKNGGLYKREVLDSNGNTTFTEYFK